MLKASAVRRKHVEMNQQVIVDFSFSAILILSIRSVMSLLVSNFKLVFRSYKETLIHLQN